MDPDVIRPSSSNIRFNVPDTYSNDGARTSIAHMHVAWQWSSERAGGNVLARISQVVTQGESVSVVGMELHGTGLSALVFARKDLLQELVVHSAVKFPSTQKSTTPLDHIISILNEAIILGRNNCSACLTLISVMPTVKYFDGTVDMAADVIPVVLTLHQGSSPNFAHLKNFYPSHTDILEFPLPLFLIFETSHRSDEGTTYPGAITIFGVCDVTFRSFIPQIFVVSMPAFQDFFVYEIASWPTSSHILNHPAAFSETVVANASARFSDLLTQVELVSAFERSLSSIVPLVRPGSDRSVGIVGPIFSCLLPLLTVWLVQTSQFAMTSNITFLDGRRQAFRQYCTTSNTEGKVDVRQSTFMADAEPTSTANIFVATVSCHLSSDIEEVVTVGYKNSSILHKPSKLAKERGIYNMLEAGADGYMNGRRVAEVVLKRFRDGRDPGSNYNMQQDRMLEQGAGPSAGLMARKDPAKVLVVQRALEIARIQKGTTLGYVVQLEEAVLLAVANYNHSALMLPSVMPKVKRFDGAVSMPEAMEGVLALHQDSSPSIIHLKNLNPSDVGLLGFPPLFLNFETSKRPDNGTTYPGSINNLLALCDMTTASITPQVFLTLMPILHGLYGTVVWQTSCRISKRPMACMYVAWICTNQIAVANASARDSHLCTQGELVSCAEGSLGCIIHLLGPFGIGRSVGLAGPISSCLVPASNETFMIFWDLVQTSQSITSKISFWVGLETLNQYCAILNAGNVYVSQSTFMAYAEPFTANVLGTKAEVLKEDLYLCQRVGAAEDTFLYAVGQDKGSFMGRDMGLYLCVPVGMLHAVVLKDGVGRVISDTTCYFSLKAPDAVVTVSSDLRSLIKEGVMTRDNNLIKAVVTLHQGGAPSIIRLKNLDPSRVDLLWFPTLLFLNSETSLQAHKGTNFPVAIPIYAKCHNIWWSSILPVVLTLMPPVQDLLDYETVSRPTSGHMFNHSTAFMYVTWPHTSEIADVNAPARVSHLLTQVELFSIGEGALDSILVPRARPFVLVRSVGVVSSISSCLLPDFHKTLSTSFWDLIQTGRITITSGMAFRDGVFGFATLRYPRYRGQGECPPDCFHELRCCAEGARRQCGYGYHMLFFIKAIRRCCCGGLSSH